MVYNPQNLLLGGGAGLPRPFSSSILRRIQEEESTTDLFRQVENQERSLTLEGKPPKETTKKPGPSVVSRIFDLIQRPLYGVANQVKTAIDIGQGDKNPLEFLTAGVRGLAGIDKTTASDVMREAGVKNKAALSIGGFVGDILLDPTTYLTLGTSAAIKKGAQVTATKLGGQVAKEAAETATAKIIASATKQAASQGLGKRATKKLVSQTVKENRKPISQEIASAVDTWRAGSAIPDAKFQVKFLGKPVFSSKGAYDFGLGINKLAHKSETVSKAHRLLSTSYRMPKHAKAAYLGAMNKGFFEYEKFLKSAKEQIEDTLKGHDFKSADEILKRVSHRIENGTISTASDVEQKLAQVWYDMKKQWYDTESLFGLHEPNTFLENYVHHTYNNTAEAADKKLGRYGQKLVGTENPPFAQGRKVSSLQEAKALGLDPVERLDEIIAHRAQKHYEVIARADFMERLSEFGVKAPTDPLARGSFVEEMKRQGLTQGQSRYYVKPPGGGDKMDVWFDPDVARAINMTEQITARDPAVGHFLKMYDNVQSKFKFMAAVANPASQAKNLMGDIWSNFTAGLVNPKTYNKSAHMVKKYRAGGSGKNLTFKVGRVVVPDGKLDEIYTHLGLKSGYTRVELAPTKMAMIKKHTSKVADPIRVASEYREDFGRMALFIDQLTKHGKGAKSLDDVMKAADKSAEVVRKHLFDYNDLTRQEKLFFRRVIPFYTFMRKNIPLQMELLATKPGRVAVMPKSLRAIQEATGLDLADKSFPGLSNLAPQWLRESAAVRLAEGPMGAGGTYMTPPFPFVEAAQMFQHPTELLEKISPLIKAPTELITKRRLSSGGAPIQEGNIEYLLNQLPQTRALLGRGQQQSLMNRLRTINPLLYDVGNPELKSELRRLQAPMKTATAERNKLLERLYGIPADQIKSRDFTRPYQFNLRGLRGFRGDEYLG
jgi:hypothetical protein